MSWKGESRYLTRPHSWHIYLADMGKGEKFCWCFGYPLFSAVSVRKNEIWDIEKM